MVLTSAQILHAFCYAYHTKQKSHDVKASCPPKWLKGNISLLFVRICMRETPLGGTQKAALWRGSSGLPWYPSLTSSLSLHLLLSFITLWSFSPGFTEKPLFPFKAPLDLDLCRGLFNPLPPTLRSDHDLEAWSWPWGPSFHSDKLHPWRELWTMNSVQLPFWTDCCCSIIFLYLTSNF